MTMIRLSVATLVAACAVVATAAQTPPQAPEGYPAPGTSAVITLLSPGSAPRTPLRYVVPNGFKQRGRFTTTMSMAMSTQGITMPPVQVPAMAMDLDFAVTAVAANGDISYSVAYGGIAVEGTGAAADAMRRGLRDFESFRGSAVMTNRGVTTSLSVDSGTNNPQLRAIMGSLSQSIQSMSMALPEDAIGAGARWEVRQAMALNVVQTYQRLSIELVGAEGPVVSLRAATEQTAPSQILSDPRLPPGAEIRLQRLTGSGSGTLTLRLGELIPTGEMEARSTTEMEVRMNGTSQPMSTETSMKVLVAPVD
jgi:hypothetical protein